MTKDPAPVPPAEPPSPERERQILRGAAIVFAEDGYEGASMSRIACRAGMAKGSLYNYFDNKADLFTAYVRHECRTNLSMVFDAIGDDTDLRDGLRTIGLRMQRLMFSPAGLTIYRVVLAEAGKFPDLARCFYEAGPAMAIRFLSEWLARQNGLGRLRIDDTEFAAEQFYTLCRTRYGHRRELRLLTEPPPGGLERAVNAAVDMFLRYYSA